MGSLSLSLAAKGTRRNLSDVGGPRLRNDVDETGIYGMVKTGRSISLPQNIKKIDLIMITYRRVACACPILLRQSHRSISEIEIGRPDLIINIDVTFNN